VILPISALRLAYDPYAGITMTGGIQTDIAT
jgi:hypothetical protein